MQLTHSDKKGAPKVPSKCADTTSRVSTTKILRPKEVSRLIGVSTNTLWRWSREGRFPPRRQLGQNSVGYSTVEVERWIEERRISV